MFTLPPKRGTSRKQKLIKKAEYRCKQEAQLMLRHATRYHPEGEKVSATASPPYYRILLQRETVLTYRQASGSYSTAIAQCYRIENF